MNAEQIDNIFMACVDLLNWMADLIGWTYEEINVIIFCVIWPLAFVAVIADNVRLRAKIRGLEVGSAPVTQNQRGLELNRFVRQSRKHRFCLKSPSLGPSFGCI